MVGLVVAALFGVNDALDVITWQAVDRWGFFIVFLLFAALVMWRLLRLQERLDNREHYRRIIADLGPFVRQGNALMEMHGRASYGLQSGGLQSIGQWNIAVGQFLRQQYPTVWAYFENDGDVFQGSEFGPSVASQQLKGRLLRLNDIMAELRESERSS